MGDRYNNMATTISVPDLLTTLCTQTLTHIYILYSIYSIYIYIYVCVCMCVYEFLNIDGVSNYASILYLLMHKLHACN